MQDVHWFLSNSLLGGTCRCISLCIRPWMKFMVYPSKYGIRIHLWCHKGTSGIWVTRLWCCYDRVGIWSLKGQICRSTYTDRPLPNIVQRLHAVPRACKQVYKLARACSLLSLLRACESCSVNGMSYICLTPRNFAIESLVNVRDIYWLAIVSAICYLINVSFR